MRAWDCPEQLSRSLECQEKGIMAILPRPEKLGQLQPFPPLHLPTGGPHPQSLCRWVSGSKTAP